MLVALTAAGISQDKTGRIPTGFTGLSKAFAFTAADSIAGHGGRYIVESDSIVLLITNPQKFAQNQTFTTTLEKASGTPAVTITLRGRVTSTDSWHPIGTPISWTTSANNGSITSTAPVNYNWLMVSYVTDATDQCVKILTADLKTSNAFEVPTSAGTITFSRPTAGVVTLTSKDNNADAALTIGAGGTGALTLGDAGSTTAITSSDWAIGATGIQTGMGAITSNGLITGTAGATLSGAAINLNASSNFATNINTGTTDAALSLGGGSGTVAVNSSVWDVTTAGVVTGFKTVTTTADADNVIINPYTDLHAIDVQINSASKFSVDSTGNVVAAGLFSGGLQLVNVVTNTDESETLTAAQSGYLVTTDGAATVTIPDPSAATVGVIYYLMQTADASLTVTATTANSNSIICDGVATTDSVAITTAGHQIGAGMVVIGISATKWYVGGLNPESVLTPEAAD